MSTTPEMTLSRAFAQAYEDGLAFHGDIGLSLSAFETRLRSVVEKRLGINPPLESVVALLGNLHLKDFYLASGCSEPTDLAWRHFVAVYAKHIAGIARSVTRSTNAGNELAADVLSHLSMHDRSDRSRIASYDGQQKLYTWLRAIISHRAANETLRKSARLEPLEVLVDLKDYEKAERIEADLRASRYRRVINDCFKVASDSLTERERLVLLLRFDDGLRIVEIGRQLKVDPTWITKLLQQTYEKLRRRIMSHLTNTYRLGPAAIKECLADILENPEHSIIALMRDAPDCEKERAIARVC